jgi:dihydroorotase (multifunctional complex type)
VIVDSVLTNAKAYLKERGQIVDCCIAIEEGKIQKIGREPQMPQADEKTDLHNLLVLPGLIDEHVHLRDEGRAYKEDFASGTAAAAAGGFTTILDMPNNDPVTMSVGRLQNRMETARRRLLVNVGFYSELPKTLPEIKDIAETGAVAFKLFLNGQVGGVNIDDDAALMESFKAASDAKRLVAVHAEDYKMIAANEEKLKRAKRNSPVEFLRAHTEDAELHAVQRLLKLTQETDVQLHFLHISTAAALEAIANAKKEERKVTCEVTPNHLMLTSNDVERLGGLAIMAPPLRDRVQADALWKGIDDGTVDALGSDHAPHSLEEKMASSVWEVKPGIPGLEVTLPLMLTMLRKNKLTINQVVALLAEKPAEIYGLTDRGQLKAGLNADLTIVDYNRLHKIDAAKFKSKAKFSPYNGWEVYGKPAKTIVNGTLVYDDGDIVAKGGVGAVVRGGNA